MLLTVVLLHPVIAHFEDMNNEKIIKIKLLFIDFFKFL